MEDSTDIFGISEGGFEPPKLPPRYATDEIIYRLCADLSEKCYIPVAYVSSLHCMYSS